MDLDDLDTYIRGSLILWLLILCPVKPGSALTRRLSGLEIKGAFLPAANGAHGAVLMLMLTGSVILIATVKNPGLIIRYLCIIFLGIGLPIWGSGRIKSRRRQPYNLDRK